MWRRNIESGQQPSLNIIVIVPKNRVSTAFFLNLIIRERIFRWKRKGEDILVFLPKRRYTTIFALPESLQEYPQKIYHHSLSYQDQYSSVVTQFGNRWRFHFLSQGSIGPSITSIPISSQVAVKTLCTAYNADESTILRLVKTVYKGV